MKNSLYNQAVQKVRDEVSVLVKGKTDPRSQQVPSAAAAAAPAYYHQPPSNSSTASSYSHTANSTAGYSQRNAYPILLENNHGSERMSIIEKTESFATNLLGNVVGHDTVAAATHSINSVITSGRSARDFLQNSATVQLVSKNSGRLLQVVMSPNGILTFDGNGAANGFNTYFVVEQSEQGRVRFHNNCNYLAFEGKKSCVMSFPPGVKNNPSIDFRIHDILGTRELVAFESCACKNHFISILPDGNLKTAHTKEKTIDAQFSVVPVVNNQQPMYPYQAQSYQQYNMNPYGGFPPNGVTETKPPQASMYAQQPTAPPPPPSYTASVYNQAPASSTLYPKFE
ncbi:unnamed protein product [Rotaria magnacalcarata]|uniref:Uncharacterized protein n=2 Tax=Rotaria magnacalcarata TaxID=392030 RepID=A0A814J5X1_9BILA|nr:unnamed protein product [Rotaria magnacalcarata]CAF1644836.1 unnamed protein product [Rotaria magnacalcarata]CAF2042925.1 unnamed protein product [Rotaria magnacalcarata]CAF2083866.1 unnamed protein product [Rotaria magnacalcarata]CAF3872741.1 unnamed protein product [Rotaria magnacalcarata]